VKAKELIDALSSATDAQLERIGYCVYKGILRAEHDAAHPAKPAEQPKPQRVLRGGEIVERVFATPEAQAALEEFEDEDNHSAGCEGLGCARCKTWTATRAERIKTLGQVYVRARRGGIAEPDLEQMSQESLVPVAVIRQMLSELPR
jgi:hypothetical protein